MKSLLIVGNWKMNGMRAHLDEVEAIGRVAAAHPAVEVGLCLPATLIMAGSERRGAAFTATPLHCGSAALDPEGLAKPRGAYVPTIDYCGRTAPNLVGTDGIRLGAMVTASGAAANAR